MNEIMDQIAEWVQREPTASVYLAICAFIVLQTYVLFGR